VNPEKIIWTENALQELERLLGARPEFEIADLEDSLGGLDFPWPITVKNLIVDVDVEGVAWVNLVIEFDEISGAGAYEVRMTLLADDEQFERYTIDQPEILFQYQNSGTYQQNFPAGTTSQYTSSVQWNSNFGGYYYSVIADLVNGFNIRRSGDLAVLVTSGAAQDVSGGFDTIDAVIDPGPQTPVFDTDLWPEKLYDLKVVVCRDGNLSNDSGTLRTALADYPHQRQLVNLTGTLCIVPGWSDADMVALDYNVYPYVGDAGPPHPTTIESPVVSCKPGDLVVAGAMCNGGYIEGWFPTPSYTATGFPAQYLNYSAETGYPGGTIIAAGVVDDWETTTAQFAVDTDSIYTGNYRSGGGIFIAVFRKP
jgi:hypothetical protein